LSIHLDMLGPMLARMSEHANLAAVAVEVERAADAASLSAITFAWRLVTTRRIGQQPADAA
jgi:hypothetical protein